MAKLTKTDFRKFLECPREFWMSFNCPDKLPSDSGAEARFRFRQGYEVEKVVREYLTGRDGDIYRFQEKVETDELLAKFDVSMHSDSGVSIFEIKSSKFRDPEVRRSGPERKLNLFDAAFQVLAARQSGLDLRSAMLVTLNGEYVLEGALDPEKFLHFEDVTEEIGELENEVVASIAEAFRILREGPGDGFDSLCSLKLDCPYFLEFHTGLPRPSVLEIPRISEKRLAPLIEEGIFALSDLPEHADLTEKQREWVEDRLRQKPSIDRDAISKALELEHPLYFLDYETVNPSVPRFQGTSPLQLVPFQYSLHVRREPGAEAEHMEFLSEDGDALPRAVAESLSRHIGPSGTVIVWYKQFEVSRNNEMASMYPEYADFFNSVNERVFDLWEIFSKSLYSHPDLPNNSLKTVLPHFAPDLSYKELEIGNGGDASARWFEDVLDGVDETRRAETLEALRIYCELDTLAMVEIFDALRTL